MKIDDVTAWVSGGGLLSMFGGIFLQQRRQVASLQDELKDERKDCRESIKELRQQQAQSDKQQRQTVGLVIELAERLGAGDVSARARSISPRPSPAVKEPHE